MLWWYAAYVAALVALVAWYFGNLSDPEFVTPCRGNAMECGGSDEPLLVVIALVSTVLLATCLVVSWVVLRLTSGWTWPATVVGTFAAVVGPLLIVLLGYLHMAI